MFYRSFKYAVKGVIKTLRSERNFRVMIVCFMLAVTAGILLGLSGIEWALILLCCGGVLSFEMLNTAIECVVDMVQSNAHPLAEKAKDIAAGFVLVFSVFAAVIGLVVFVPHIIALFK
ncbi:MAG: diacylglycerol kinase family protein [Eubacteriales bacterium]|nr:diacylglycerol kinase family protein [Eubacteriales bacterium]